MSKKIPLTKYRKLLLAEKKRVLMQLNAEVSQFHDLEKNETGDIVDHAFNMYEKNMTIQMSEGDKKILQAIDHALKRVDNGTFGNCTTCGKPIDGARLEVLPWALTCVDPRRCPNNKVPKNK